MPAEAAVALTIDPRFWQTVVVPAWRVLVAIVLGSAGLYRLRMHQVARQLNVRFEERLAERTRIAQDLHDTLLQGFVSASMQLHVAADTLPPDSPAKRALDRVLAVDGASDRRGPQRRARASSPASRAQTISSSRSARVVQELGVADARRRSRDRRRPAARRSIRSSATRSTGSAARRSSTRSGTRAPGDRGRARLCRRRTCASWCATMAAASTTQVLRVGTRRTLGTLGHARAGGAHRRAAQGVEPRRLPAQKSSCSCRRRIAFRDRARMKGEYDGRHSHSCLQR